MGNTQRAKFDAGDFSYGYNTMSASDIANYRQDMTRMLAKNKLYSVVSMLPPKDTYGADYATQLALYKKSLGNVDGDDGTATVVRTPLSTQRSNAQSVSSLYNKNYATSLASYKAAQALFKAKQNAPLGSTNVLVPKVVQRFRSQSHFTNANSATIEKYKIYANAGY
jgi:hypothetical protein